MPKGKPTTERSDLPIDLGPPITPAEVNSRDRYRNRLAVRRLAYQEAMREQLQEYGSIGVIINCLGEIDKIRKRVAKVPTARYSQAYHSKVKVQLEALKTTIDSHYKMLAKYLPDLKTMELTDEQGGNPLADFARAMNEALIKVGYRPTELIEDAEFSEVKANGRNGSDRATDSD